jgi:hypothetical protein
LISILIEGDEKDRRKEGKKKKETNFRIATTRKNGAPCIGRKVELEGVTE